MRLPTHSLIFCTSKLIDGEVLLFEPVLKRDHYEEIFLDHASLHELVCEESNMYQPKKLQAQPNLRVPPLPRSNSEAKSRVISSIVRFVALVAVVLVTPIGSKVLARQAPQAGPKAASAINPDAIEALNKMGIYLRTLKSFQVEAAITTDGVLDDGQTIQSSKTVDLLAARPNRLRAEMTGDGEHKFLLFDGKDFTIFGALVNYYATVPAPPTISGVIDKLSDRYGIEFPLIDLFKWGTDESTINRITAADDIGPSSVDGVTCEQYAFRQQGVDWQIWIQLGEFPLPRKIIIRTLTDDAKPQHSETLNWNLAPSFSDDVFTFSPPPDAHRIVIEEMNADSTEKKQ
jgi:hypothetical protein